MARAVLGYQYLVFDWTMIAITFFVVLIRLYVRVYLRGSVFKISTWRWSELFVILGWLLFMGIGICDSFKVHAGSRNLTPGFQMTPEEFVVFYKAQFAWSWLYKPSVYMMKFALLFFYVELTENVQERRIWIAIIVTFIINAMGLIAQWLYIALQCLPISRQWTLTPAESCANIVAYPVVTWGFYVLTDILIFILPFAILKIITVQAGRSSFGGLSGALAMFSLGIINVASAITIMALRLEPPNYLDRPLGPLGEATELLYTIQLSTAIVIPCCPQIRQFIKPKKSNKSTPRMNTYMARRLNDTPLSPISRAHTLHKERMNVQVSTSSIDGGHRLGTESQQDLTESAHGSPV